MRPCLKQGNCWLEGWLEGTPFPQMGVCVRKVRLNFSYCIWAGTSIMYLILQNIWTGVSGEPCLQG